MHVDVEVVYLGRDNARHIQRFGCAVILEVVMFLLRIS